MVDPLTLYTTLSEETSDVAASGSPQDVGDDDHNAPGSPPLSGVTSTGEGAGVGGDPAIISEGPSRGSHDASAQTAGDGATRGAPCPGPSIRDGVEGRAEIANLLKVAEKNGADARKLGVGSLVKFGKKYECQSCQKRDRRDRLLSHVLLDHFQIKTWACPLWFVCFC
jgi:hypothetical protein